MKGNGGRGARGWGTREEIRRSHDPRFAWSPSRVTATSARTIELGDRVGGTLEGKGIEVECDSARETAKRERERDGRDMERKERCGESAKRGKMPTITPPSVPSRFQVRPRFMRLIPALFLASASRPGIRFNSNSRPIIRLRYIYIYILFHLTVVD